MKKKLIGCKMYKFDKKFGKIEVTEELCDDFWKHIKDFTPTRIEYRYASRIFYIEAYSKYFRLLKEGDSIPKYMPIFRKFKNGNVRLKGFEEIK